MSAATPIPTAVLLILSSVCAYGQAEKGDWQPLFDGKSLQSWKVTPFTGGGTARVENGTLILPAGKPMTGVTWTGAPLAKVNYEVRLEAARKQGSDFFASLTFPVGDSYCTWVTGGWGGDIVGLSSIDGWDAADNETRTYFTFETARWYALRLLVTPDKITAWIDGKSVIDVVITGRNIGLRHGETQLTVPLGFMSYGTTGAIRNVEYRPLPVKR